MVRSFPRAVRGRMRRALLACSSLLRRARRRAAAARAGVRPRAAARRADRHARLRRRARSGTPSAERSPASDTVMRLLQRNFDVKTRYGGGFVQEIDGVAGGREDGRPVDWFYYVNGIEARDGRGRRASSRPATASGGTTTTGAPRMRVPAVVGSFPEPFLHGVGRQAAARPARLRGDAGPRRATRSQTRLERRRRDAGRARSAPAAPAARRCCASLVGPLGRRARATRPPRSSSAGPRPRGVFARLDRRRAARSRCSTRAAGPCARSAPGAGLVAATRLERPAADLGRHRHRRRRRRGRGRAR